MCLQILQVIHAVEIILRQTHSLIVEGKIAMMKNPLQMHQSSICKGFSMVDMSHDQSIMVK